MKIIILCIMLLVMLSGVCFATANTETGDKAARPVSCYGKQSDGTLTPILVNSDGIAQIKTE